MGKGSGRGEGHLAEGRDGGHADLEERVRDALDEAFDGGAVAAADDAGEGPDGGLAGALAARLEVEHDAVEDARVARDEGAQRLHRRLARRPVAVLQPPHELRDRAAVLRAARARAELGCGRGRRGRVAAAAPRGDELRRPDTGRGLGGCW